MTPNELRHGEFVTASRVKQWRQEPTFNDEVLMSVHVTNIKALVLTLELAMDTLRTWHDPVACESGPACQACKVLTTYNPEWSIPND
jgi:hypothetical protein